MITTGNYNLKKPEGTDPVDIQDFNDNADIIDAELAKRASKDVATTSANGLMSAVDKSKLNGIANNANNYSLPIATSSIRGGVTLSDSINDISGAGQGAAATPFAVEKVMEQVNDLTTNIQQEDVIAQISSSANISVSKTINVISKDYRAYEVVLCNGDAFDHTVINTYTWLSCMVNGYYKLDLCDPGNNMHVGYVEFQTNSIFVYLYDNNEYYVDIYGLLSL